MSMWELVLLLTAVAFISAMASSGNLKLGIRYKGFLEPPPESNINMEKEKPYYSRYLTWMKEYNMLI